MDRPEPGDRDEVTGAGEELKQGEALGVGEALKQREALELGEALGEAPGPPAVPPMTWKRAWIRFFQFNGWWILFLILIVLPLMVVVNFVPGWLEGLEDLEQAVDEPWMAPLALATLLAGWCATWRMKRSEGFSWADVGFPRQHVMFDLVVGFAIGVASFALVVALGLLTGMAAVEPQPISGATARSMWLSLAALTPAAAFEEVLTRGFIFQVFALINLPASIVITSVWFAVPHLPNPGAINWVAIVVLIQAGLLLAVGRWRSGGLWLPITWHLAWNFAQGWIFGAKVSGMEPASAPLLVTEFTGPELLSGGRFGPESSLLAVAAEIVTMILFVRFFPRRRPDAGRSELIEER